MMRRYIHTLSNMTFEAIRGDEDAIAIPAPRNHFLVDDAMRGQVPAVLGGIGGDALEQAMVIPTEREQDITRAFHVGTGKGQLTELGRVTKNGTD